MADEVVLWLNGPFGVGKTTVDRTVLDDRRRRVPAMRMVVLDASPETIRARAEADVADPAARQGDSTTSTGASGRSPTPSSANMSAPPGHPRRS